MGQVPSVPVSDAGVTDVQVNLVESVAMVVSPAPAADALVPAPPPVPRPVGTGPNVERRTSSAKSALQHGTGSAVSVVVSNSDSPPVVLTDNPQFAAGSPAAQ